MVGYKVDLPSVRLGIVELTPDRRTVELRDDLRPQEVLYSVLSERLARMGLSKRRIPEYTRAALRKLNNELDSYVSPVSDNEKAASFVAETSHFSTRPQKYGDAEVFLLSVQNKLRRGVLDSVVADIKPTATTLFSTPYVPLARAHDRGDTPLALYEGQRLEHPNSAGPFVLDEQKHLLALELASSLKRRGVDTDVDGPVVRF